MSEEGMDKYGVQVDQEKVKEASQSTSKGVVCPVCSAQLDNGGACPIHGTEPFESRPKER